MSESLDFNPALPESRQFTPPAEGGNGNIHKPGDYHNLIWQTRSRVAESWELELIATLETLSSRGGEPDAAGGRAEYPEDARSARRCPERRELSGILQVNGY